MKKTSFLLTLLGFFIFPAFSFGMDVSLKISGGLGSLNPGMINSALKDWEEANKKESKAAQNWNFLGGSVSELQSSFDFESEFLFSLTKHMSLSLGSGYIYGEVPEEKTELTIDKVLGTFISSYPVKITGLPLTLSGYYRFPLTTRMELFFKGGAGFLWAKYADREGVKRLPATNSAYPQQQTASARGTLVHGGLGILFKIESDFQFFLEGSIRHAKINGFRGENKDGEEGILYSFEEYNPQIDFWQKKNRILPDEPSGENFRSVQETVIDFTGFSVKIGMIIKF